MLYCVLCNCFCIFILFYFSSFSVFFLCVCFFLLCVFLLYSVYDFIINKYIAGVVVQIFVRALFDYDPSTDDLISCREAGLAFSAGDVLHILAKDDHRWWQARHWTDDSTSQSLQLAGLIPSAELLEWKTSCSTIERAKRKHTAKIGGSYHTAAVLALMTIPFSGLTLLVGRH